PKQMETAGTPGAYASIIEHVGRISGTIYRTPVGTEATDDGFLIMLPYGTRADWVRNVLAAGSAVVTTEGETVAVDQPEILDTAGIADQLPDGEQRLLKLFNVEHCMRVRRVAAGTRGGAE
ncbi:MAG: nitroreductase family deazaflavin-dependent oxidoreductase, partial [Acidimicrobiia bacterium]|nr:nitroreductase family deazaflavin-dependent oxidoreductase [Acidimicrobiia bacterium]